MLVGRAVIQRDLDRLETWLYGNLLKLSKGKRKVSHLGRNKPMHQEGWALTAGRSQSEKDLAVLVGQKLNTRQEYALAAKAVNGILGCISKSAASMSIGMILPFNSALVRLHCVQFWVSQ